LSPQSERHEDGEVGTRRRWSGRDEPLVKPERGREDVATDDRPRPEDVAHEAERAPLFSEEEATQLRTRWESVQAGFVDDPRRAVEEADALVGRVMDRLTDGFKQQREQLERGWGDRDETSTEELRVALRHYRSFFDRLLKI
jgi:hypothetical protein